MSASILVAGIGNIFLGDDAFGVETVKALARNPAPEGVTIRDFGIRGHSLAYTLCEGYRAVILVDAIPRGKEPGTLSLLEVDPPPPGADVSPVSSGHDLDPVAVLQLVAALGGSIGRLYVVGCAPAVLEPADGSMTLSPAVAAAVPRAVEMIGQLITTLQNDPNLSAGQPPALAMENQTNECR